MTDPSRITIHMVSSLDYYIASKDGSVTWFETPDTFDNGKDLAEIDVEAFLKSIDCYILGSRTYETALELGWPYGDVPTIVLTHRDLPKDRNSVEFYSGDLNRLVNERLKPRYRNIWMVGGAMLAREFIRLKLADDFRLTLLPIMLGGGTRFLDDIGIEQPLHLKEVTAYKTGMVELWYEIRKG